LAEGHPVLLERAPGVSIPEIIDRTEAVLSVPEDVPEMTP
jgi:acyl CoA:acetate/3-ketoacid CoA transferase beta subunit